MVTIHFYITPGTGFLLLGNGILHKSKKIGLEGLLLVPKGVRSIADGEIILQICSDCENYSSLHTYLYVVLTKCRSIRLHFAAFNSLKARQVGTEKLTAAKLSIGGIS